MNICSSRQRTKTKDVIKKSYKINEIKDLRFMKNSKIYLTKKSIIL